MHDLKPSNPICGCCQPPPGTKKKQPDNRETQSVDSGCTCSSHADAKRILVELSINGMHCVNCAANIERHLQKLGLEDAQVSFTTATASFFTRQPELLPRVREEISRLGYQVEEIGAKVHHRAFWTLERKVLFCLFWTIPLLLPMLIPHWHWLHSGWLQLAFCLPVFILGMLHFGRSAWISLRSGSANMDVLIAMSVSAAFVYSLTGLLLQLGPDYLFFETSASIVSVVLIGNLLEAISVKKTTSAIQDLAQMQPAFARRIRLRDGAEDIEHIACDSIQKDDVLLVSNGDRIPVDGILVHGQGCVDQSFLTGESLPLELTTGAVAIGGSIVVQGAFRLQATAVGQDTVLASMIKLVKQAQNRKPRIQRLGDQVSAIFVPLVVIISAVAFALSFFVLGAGFQEALLRAVAVLVVACPCAMGLATPTAIMVGVGEAARHGILIKGGDTLEHFAGIKTLVFDKTGTLTTGQFRIQSFTPAAGVDRLQAQSVLLGLELHSSHPIAKSLHKELTGVVPYPLQEVQEQRGFAVQGQDAAGNIFRAGSARILNSLEAAPGHSVYLTKNDQLMAWLDLEDEIKPGAAQTIQRLQDLAVQSVLLSGDDRSKCTAVANQLGITEIYAEHLPSEKLQVLESLESKRPSAFVGDGVNDAPALAQARVGVSLSNAAAAAIDSARIVLLNGRVEQLVPALLISRATLRIIKQNLFWAFFYNCIAIPAAAAGALTPMLAALAMAFSDVVVVANSLRLKSWNKVVYERP